MTAVVHACHQFLWRCVAFEASTQGRRRRDPCATHGAFLRLHLNVETEIHHRIIRSCDVTTLVASHAASELAVEGLVKEARATLLMAFSVVLSAKVKLVDEKLVILVCVLLLISCQSLNESPLASLIRK